MLTSFCNCWLKIPYSRLLQLLGHFYIALYNLMVYDFLVEVAGKKPHKPKLFCEVKQNYPSRSIKTWSLSFWITLFLHIDYSSFLPQSIKRDLVANYSSRDRFFFSLFRQLRFTEWEIIPCHSQDVITYPIHSQSYRF